MGRPEGPGCYCAANNMLRLIIDKIADSYPWVVIDNEAGLEHLSRRTTRDVDVLFIVSDATVRGITTAGRVAALLGELETKVGRHYLIVNRAAHGSLARARGRDRRARPRPARRPAGRPDWSPSSTPPASRSSACRPTAPLSAALEPVVAAALATRREQGGRRCSSSVRTSTSSPRRSRRPSRPATPRPSRGWPWSRSRPAPASSTSTSARRRSSATRSCRGSSQAVQEVVDVPALARHHQLRGDGGGPQGLQAARHAQLGLGRPRAPATASCSWRRGTAPGSSP